MFAVWNLLKGYRPDLKEYITGPDATPLQREALGGNHPEKYAEVHRDDE